MIDRNLSLPHELVCATDDAAGLDAGIRVAPLEKELIRYGNAFPKLAAFRPDAAELFGERLCVIDLDAVICGSLDPLLDRYDDDFVVWEDVLARSKPDRFKYNTSMVLMNAGARAQVWETFDRKTSPMTVMREHRCGSDQAWVSRQLNGEKMWTREDGVLSYRFDVQDRAMPDNARIVFFHGKPKPWEIPANSIVKQHWN